MVRGSEVEKKSKKAKTEKSFQKETRIDYAQIFPTIKELVEVEASQNKAAKTQAGFEFILEKTTNCYQVTLLIPKEPSNTYNAICKRFRDREARINTEGTPFNISGYEVNFTLRLENNNYYFCMEFVVFDDYQSFLLAFAGKKTKSSNFIRTHLPTVEVFKSFFLKVKSTTIFEQKYNLLMLVNDNGTELSLNPSEQNSVFIHFKQQQPNSQDILRFKSNMRNTLKNYPSLMTLQFQQNKDKEHIFKFWLETNDFCNAYEIIYKALASIPIVEKKSIEAQEIPTQPASPIEAVTTQPTIQNEVSLTFFNQPNFDKKEEVDFISSNLPGK